MDANAEVKASEHTLKYFNKKSKVQLKHVDILQFIDWSEVQIQF